MSMRVRHAPISVSGSEKASYLSEDDGAGTAHGKAGVPGTGLLYGVLALLSAWPLGDTRDGDTAPLAMPLAMPLASPPAPLPRARPLAV